MSRVNVADGKITWPDKMQYAAPGAGLSAPSGSVGKLLAWLFKDAFLDALTVGIDQVTGGLSASERGERVTEIEEHLLRLEYQEESLIEQALASGIEVQRRYDASGFALLGIELPSHRMVMEAAE
jgi:hypothetical protein